VVLILAAAGFIGPSLAGPAGSTAVVGLLEVERLPGHGDDHVLVACFPVDADGERGGPRRWHGSGCRGI